MHLRPILEDQPGAGGSPAPGTSGSRAPRLPFDHFPLVFLLGSLFSLSGCALEPATRGVSFTLDLRRPEDGTIAVRAEVAGRAGHAIVLSSFVQAPALSVESIEAHAGGGTLSVEKGRDEKGFGRFTIEAPPRSGPILIDYVVRPGAQEEAKMSGPTGYRFGHLSRDFGLVGGRQIFLLETEPSPPADIRIRFLTLPGPRLLVPWPAEGDPPAARLRGRDAVARLLQGILAIGRFESASSAAESFRVDLLASLPEATRTAAARRALALEEHLAATLGRPARPYDLILVPKAPDGSSISVPASPVGLALSMGDGLPTRWLTIGRAIGRASLADRLAALPEADPGREILQALPTYLTVLFSERDGWRSRQAWLEQFYYDTAGLDFADPDQASDPMKREWRTVVALDRLSGEMGRRGLGTIEDLCRGTLGRGRPLDWDRLVRHDLPPDLREGAARWFAKSPLPFPFPGTAGNEPPLLLAPPPSLAADAGHDAARRDGTRGDGRRRPPGRLDLYLGGHNLGLLEQCGCRSKQMGGMARRATVLRRRLAAGPRALSLELGDALPFDQHAPMLDRQKTAESDLALSLLAYSGTSASVVAHAELAYGPEFLRARVERLPSGFRLLAANLRAPGLALPPALEAPAPGPRLRVLGLVDPGNYHLGRALEFEDATASITIVDPVAALRAILGKGGAPGLTAVAGTLGPSAILAIHEAFPDVRLILTDDYFHLNEDPRLRFERPTALSTFGMLGKTLVVMLESDSYGLVRLGLDLGADATILGAELQDLDLDDAIPDDAVVRARLDAHYARLARASGLAEVAPIGTRLRESLGAAYVGADACASCHAAETEQWRSTDHASAFATLLAKRRQGVPGCYACHVTGYRQPGGYRTIADLRLRHVQCEACHGPGGAHLEDPRARNIVRTPTASVCTECHTEKHSEMTDANFARYWSKITHAGAGVVR